jgi:hypothetical protein
MTDTPAKHVELTTVKRAGKFFLTKVKRQALDFSSKWVAQIAAGASALAIQSVAAAYFDYNLDVGWATLISSAVTLAAGAAAGYLKSETLAIPEGEITPLAEAPTLNPDFPQ